MYAVINTGGKQYRLTEGDLLEVERLEGEIGDEVVFDEVLMLGDTDEPLVGSPQIQGAQVVGTIVEQKKGDKVIVFKYKKRKMYRRKAGHRQLLTTVKIDSILDGSSEPKKSSQTEKKETASKTASDQAPEKRAEAKDQEKAAATDRAESQPKKATTKKSAGKTKAAKAEPETKKSSKSAKETSEVNDEESDKK